MSEGAIMALVVLAIVAAAGYGIHRFLRHLATPDDGSIEAHDADGHHACVTCGSGNVSHPRDGVTLCADCGYEGGVALALEQSQRHREAILAMPPGERARSAAADLQEAAGYVVSARQLAGQLHGMTAGAGLHRMSEINIGELAGQLELDLTRLERALTEGHKKVASLDLKVDLPELDMTGGDVPLTTLISSETYRAWAIAQKQYVANQRRRAELEALVPLLGQLGEQIEAARKLLPDPSIS